MYVCVHICVYANMYWRQFVYWWMLTFLQAVSVNSLNGQAVYRVAGDLWEWIDSMLTIDIMSLTMQLTFHSHPLPFLSSPFLPSSPPLSSPLPSPLPSLSFVPLLLHSIFFSFSPPFLHPPLPFSSLFPLLLPSSSSSLFLFSSHLFLLPSLRFPFLPSFPSLLSPPSPSLLLLFSYSLVAPSLLLLLSLFLFLTYLSSSLSLTPPFSPLPFLSSPLLPFFSSLSPISPPPSLQFPPMLDPVIDVWKYYDKNWPSTLFDVTKAGLKSIVSACWYLDIISYGEDWPHVSKMSTVDLSH